jgi:hypothetical protein
MALEENLKESIGKKIPHDQVQQGQWAPYRIFRRVDSEHTSRGVLVKGLRSVTESGASERQRSDHRSPCTSFNVCRVGVVARREYLVLLFEWIY